MSGQEFTQEIITILDFDGAIAISTTEPGKLVPVLGYSKIRGMIHSDIEIVLEVEQTPNDKGTIRRKDEFVIPANPSNDNAVEFEVIPYGKAIKFNLRNDSAIAIANVEAFLGARAYE